MVLGLLFTSRISDSLRLSMRQYARIVHRWVLDVGLETGSYGTNPMRSTKASLIYQRTETTGVSASARPHEAGEHGEVPLDRSRRHSCEGRADGCLTRKVAPRPEKIEERPEVDV